jgi:hypothetical protein
VDDLRKEVIHSIKSQTLGLGDAAAHKAAPPGDHGHLTGEFARAVCCDWAFARNVWLYDLHASGNQDEERHICVPDVEQDFVLFGLSELAS